MTLIERIDAEHYLVLAAMTPGGRIETGVRFGF
jgi:hypothetical protein